MKLTFIKVGIGGAQAADAMEPLAFAVLAELTPKAIELDFYDERVEKLPGTLSTDWVIFSANTFTIKRTYGLSVQYRKSGIRTAIGGFHTTLLPNEAAAFCNTVFVGDAEYSWQTFVDDLLCDRVRERYEAKVQPDISRTIYDNRIFGNRAYASVKPIQFSRGCRYSCDFCSIHSVYGNSLRFRDVDMVVNEIKRRKIKLAFFVDDNLFVERDRLMMLMKGIEPLKIKWVCQISMDVAEDEASVAAMARSGCIGALIGFESTDETNLIQMNKGANRHQAGYGQVIDSFRQHGIMIYGTFVIGYDSDTVAAFDRTLTFALENRFFIANFNPLIPTPGTALYERLEQEGRLRYDKWWLSPDYRYGETVFSPANMSPEALEHGCYRIRLAFNSYRHIVSRYMDFGPNLRHPLVFFGANLISKKEIIRKQGRPL